MIEEAVGFGAQGRMSGIWIQADGDPGAAAAPVALLFNAGFLHRVGPFRLWVDLARELGALGVSSLRFDLHGLGDSGAAAQPAGDATAQAVADLKSAMDFVEGRLGKRSFVVYGLCSGADYAHPAALADPRLQSLALIDAYGYKTAGYLLTRFRHRLLNLRRWRNLLRRAFGGGGPARAKLMLDEVREFPPPARVQSEIQGMLREGRRFLYIYTAGVPEYFNHRGQFWAMFPQLQPGPGLDYRYFGETDHTFALVEERRQLVELLSGFAREGRPTRGLLGA